MLNFTLTDLVDILCLSFIMSFIVDVSGVVDEAKDLVRKYGRLPADTELSIKPLDCSLCMIWWAGLAYTIITGFSLPKLAFVALNSAYARIWTEGIFLFKELIIKVIDTLLKWIDK